MKKLIFLALVLVSCNKKNPETYVPAHNKNFKIETISEEVSKGLHKVTIDDTIHILIYRGVESVTMIQVN